MRGRSCAALLTVAVLILAPGWLRSQSDRALPQPEFRLYPPLQTPPAGPETILPFPIPPVASPVLGLPQIARAAGIIFSGRVTGIARHPASARRPIETVAVTFHVESALRGTTPGESLTITQWIGLWSSGQRYRVGERVLLFLYPPSKLGLTSSVGGPMGRFRFGPRGRVLLSAQQISVLRTDSVLGGKSHISFSDFARAVRQAGEEE